VGRYLKPANSILRRLSGLRFQVSAFNRQHPFVDILLSDIMESEEALDMSELVREPPFPSIRRISRQRVKSSRSLAAIRRMPPSRPRYHYLIDYLWQNRRPSRGPARSGGRNASYRVCHCRPSKFRRWQAAVVGLLAVVLAGVIYFVPMTRFIDSLSERSAAIAAAE
jgi:hypothetical protein